jgi:hypothetical protein
MIIRKLGISTLAIWLMVHSYSTASAQAPAAPAPPTLWSFLGIPQGFRKVSGSLINRRGNFPGLEQKPPMLPIADPKNLASDVPALKAAAEIKQAEDMKKHKIKAIKYLASVGCGCYDKDGKITNALIESMSNDCTEDVRLEAVEAVSEAAKGGCCENCGATCCCNEKITEALSKIAYERDDDGCWLEPSERVREAAREALAACCPNRGPIRAQEVQRIEGGGGGTIEGSGAPEGGSPDAPTPPAEATPTPAVPTDPAAQITRPGSSRRLAASPLASLPSAKANQAVRIPANEFAGDSPHVGRRVAKPADLPPNQSSSRRRYRQVSAAVPSRSGPVTGRISDKALGGPAPATLPTDRPSGDGQSPKRFPAVNERTVKGTISQVDMSRGLVEVVFANQKTIRQGARLKVYHQYLTGRALMTELRVVRSGSGKAIAVPMDPFRMTRIARGDEIVAYR